MKTRAYVVSTIAVVLTGAAWAQSVSPATTWSGLLAAGIVTPLSQTTLANQIAPMVTSALRTSGFSGVAVDGATVNGQTLIAYETAQALAMTALVSTSKIGAPSGVAPLDTNGLVPVANLPSLSAVDSTARSSAATAATLAAAAVPAASGNLASGYAKLDTNALLPLTLFPTNAPGVDATARTAAAAAQSTAAAALPAAQKAVPNGVASLGPGGLVPVGQIDPASVATDSTARASAAAAALSAAAAIPSAQKGVGSGVATLTTNGLVPTTQIDPASVATDSTARSSASSAASLAGAAIPSSTLGQNNGPAKLSSTGLLPTTNIDPASVATDPTARTAAAAAQSTATTASNTAGAAIPSTAKAAPSGVASLDSNGLVPVGQISSSSVATDPTARSAAAAAASVAGSAVPTSTANAANGYAKLDGSALVPTGLINPASSATDSTARAAATSAQTLAAAAVPSSSLGLANGPAKLDGTGHLPATAAPALTGDVTSTAGSTATTLASSGVTAGTCLKPTVDAKGRATGCSSLAPADLPAGSTTQAGALQLGTGGGQAAAGNDTRITNAAQLDGSGTISQVPVLASGLGAVQRALSARADDVVNGADYGMACNYQVISDVSTTSGSSTITSTNHVFVPGENVLGAYGIGSLSTTVASVSNGGKTAVLNANAPATGSGETVTAYSDDTAALNRTIAVYQSRSFGARIQLPRGGCATTGNITINYSTHLDFAGMGDGATTIILTANNNLFQFTGSNLAALSAHDFAIARTGGSEAANTFNDIAIKINPLNDATNTAGQAILANITVEGQNSTDSHTGWAGGVWLHSMSRPVLYNVNVINGGAYSGNSATLIQPYPTPQSPTTAMPTQLAFGSCSDIMIDGDTSGSPENDPAIMSSGTNGGCAGVDVGTDVQGLYGFGNTLVYSDYGLRLASTSGFYQLGLWAGGQFNNVISGVYANGVNGVTLTGNYFINQFPAPSYQAVWFRNSNQNTIGNNIFYGVSNTTVDGQAGSAPKATAAIAWTYDGPTSNGFNTFPEVATGNAITGFNGACLMNDANAKNVQATGNDLASCGTYVSDPTGNNGYAPNTFTYPDMFDDGKENITFPNALTVGRPYSAGSLLVEYGPYGAQVPSLSSNVEGDIVMGGQQSIGTNLSPGHALYKAGINGIVPVGATSFLTPIGAVSTTLPASTTTPAGSAQGAANVSVASTANVVAGDKVYDSTANKIIGIVGSVPGATATPTTVTTGVPAGTTTLTVGSTTGDAVGEAVTDGGVLIGTIQSLTSTSITFPASGTLAATTTNDALAISSLINFQSLQTTVIAAGSAASAAGDTIQVLLGPQMQVGGGNINAQYGELRAHVYCRDNDDYQNRFELDTWQQYFAFAAGGGNSYGVNVDLGVATAATATETMSAIGSANTLPLTAVSGAELPGWTALDTTAGHTAYIQAGAVLKGEAGLTATLSVTPTTLPASGDVITFTGPVVQTLPSGIRVLTSRDNGTGGPMLALNNGFTHPMNCIGEETYQPN